MRRRRPPIRPAAPAAVLAALLVLPACGLLDGNGGGAGGADGGGVVATRTPVASPATPTSAAVAPEIDGVVATGLPAPWGLAFLPDGSALVTGRDDAVVRRVVPDPDGGEATVTEVGRVDGVAPEGEGGLLGIAVPPGDSPDHVLAYYTGPDDNRVVRLGWDGAALGEQTPVLTGIPKAGFHDGGRLVFGPDGFVYVATGDAGVPENAQDPASLAGKILRITPEGEPAPGNPDPGSPVWSLGHRNVQGLAFDDEGRLWASEFGAKDVDELNLITAGSNYGWPVYEGRGDDPAYVDPVVEWSPTALASPSGLAILDGSAWVASLRGARLWQVPLVGDRAAEPVAWFTGELGRLRTVEPAPDGSLWLVTSNTDGRAEPGPDDDRILRLTLS
ncbi:MAG: PQQ-dependent sugar dehydrogenase [Candidatus Nanopelagicales bacterium]